MSIQPSFLLRFLSPRWGKLAPLTHAPVASLLPPKDSVELSPERVVCPYVDLRDGHIYYYDSHAEPGHQGPLPYKEAIMASSAYPGILEPVKGKYGDGGIRTATPLYRAIADGYTTIFHFLANPPTPYNIPQG